ncbi:glycosyl hydrolase 5 family protein [Cryptomeria japonica]|uniref:glycosyl hydrolase 5 family protein n=1 Tax=Cryptomeria japonica TaxID=3369 RepID=UPI0027DA98DD|nr:glycosyl hydrolase 5 family protein [Cryptomeria japonica]
MTATAMTTAALRLLIALLLVAAPAECLPLRARGRWIVDEATGLRVKLACVNWPGHLEPGLPEGLNRLPVTTIAHTISSLGFNCVRLTYSIQMVTEKSYTEATVGQTFAQLNLTEPASGIERNNPGFLQLGHVAAYDSIVAALAEAGVMVILDNHVSKPKWCCAVDDGNGFFGDSYFDPRLWQRGLGLMATHFNNTPNVVAMSLRNELRGNRSTSARWSKYMQRGAATVHEANPNVLVVLSGLHFDTILSFLPVLPVTLPFKEKIVYEGHWYSFGVPWHDGLPNDICLNETSRFKDNIGFLTSSINGTAAPLFVSEFGIDQRYVNDNDNRYLNCILAFLAEEDVDWALWTMGGSYYYRSDKEPVQDFEETYGFFNRDWSRIRNPDFISRLKEIQQPIQDPYLSPGPYYQIIYHPASGLCVESSIGNTIHLGSCQSVRSRWNYDASVEGPIGLMGSSSCISTQGNGLPAIMTEKCSAPNNTLWSTVSSGQLQLGTRVFDEDGKEKWMCLDGSRSPLITTTECICITDSHCYPNQNPEKQWFKVITTNKQLLHQL